MITLDRLEEILSGFPSLKIGVLGDLFLDRYLEIDPHLEEISLETGLPAHQVVGIRNAPGVVGTVLNNLLALGVRQLTPISVIGDDGHGYDLLQALRTMQVETRGIVLAKNRLTPTYTKPMRGNGSSAQELSRLDVRTREPHSVLINQQLLANLQDHWNQQDGWIVLDQLADSEARVVNAWVRRQLEEWLNEAADRSQMQGDVAVKRSKPIYVDSRFNISSFRFGMLKTNAKECAASAGKTETDDILELSQWLEQRSRATGQIVICTLGPHGMLVCEPGGAPQHVEGFPVTGPIDIVGAGDSATSGMFAALLAGGTLHEAATIGNLVASITVQQIGQTGVATPAQVIDRWHETQRGAT